MDALLKSLMDTLSYEVKLHEDLLAILQDESKSIGQAPPSKLLQIQSAKQHLSYKIAGIEAQRVKIVQEIATQWDVEFKELTLSKIISQVSNDIGQPLQHYLKQLKQLITKIQQLANRNGSLSEVRLKPIEMSLRFIHDWQKSQQTYSDAGTLQSSPEKLSRASV